MCPPHLATRTITRWSLSGASNLACLGVLPPSGSLLTAGVNGWRRYGRSHIHKSPRSPREVKGPPLRVPSAS